MNHRIEIIIRRHDTEGRFFWRVTDTNDEGEVEVIDSSYEPNERTAKFAAATHAAAYLAYGMKD